MYQISSIRIFYQDGPNRIFSNFPPIQTQKQFDQWKFMLFISHFVVIYTKIFLIPDFTKASSQENLSQVSVSVILILIYSQNLIGSGY